jgi:hypothetical protein
MYRAHCARLGDAAAAFERAEAGVAAGLLAVSAAPGQPSARDAGADHRAVQLCLVTPTA